MPEILQPHEDENFIAPDESQRVEDPEKAEYMARASKQNRDRAQEQKRAYTVDGSGPIYAKSADVAAEGTERRAGLLFDEQQYLEGTDLMFARMRLRENDSALETAKDRLAQSSRADRETLE